MSPAPPPFPPSPPSPPLPPSSASPPSSSTSPPSPPSPPLLPIPSAPSTPSAPSAPSTPSAPSAPSADEDKVAGGAPATPVTFTVCHSSNEAAVGVPVSSPLAGELKPGPPSAGQDIFAVSSFCPGL